MISGFLKEASFLNIDGILAIDRQALMPVESQHDIRGFGCQSDFNTDSVRYNQRSVGKQADRCHDDTGCLRMKDQTGGLATRWVANLNSSMAERKIKLTKVFRLGVEKLSQNQQSIIQKIKSSTIL